MGEIQCIDLGIIVLLHVGLVLRDETDAHRRIHADAVGKLYCNVGVGPRYLVNHRLKVLVNLLTRLAASSLVEHSQHVAHTDGRHNYTAIAQFAVFIDGAEQIAGKIVVVIKQLVLGYGQGVVIGLLVLL